MACPVRTPLYFSMVDRTFSLSTDAFAGSYVYSPTAIVILGRYKVGGRTVTNSNPVLVLLFFSIRKRYFRVVVLRVIGGLAVVYFLGGFIARLLYRGRVVGKT